MSAFDHADAALASGAPLLAIAEPAFLLLTFAVGTAGRAIGNADAFDTFRLGSGFVLGGVELGIRRHQARCASQQGLMCVDGCDQQVRIIGPKSVNFVIDDDLILRLLQLHDLAELVGLPALPLRMTSVDGPNRLRSLLSLRVLPRKMRARVCFITS